MRIKDPMTNKEVVRIPVELYDNHIKSIHADKFPGECEWVVVLRMVVEGHTVRVLSNKDGDLHIVASMPLITGGISWFEEERFQTLSDMKEVSKDG